jgi:hypothetical protein
MMKERAAIFHPNLICLDEAVLKYLAFTFDRIYFLPNDIRLNPGHDSLTQRFSIWDGILAAAYGTLEDSRYEAMFASESPVWDERLTSLMAQYEWLESQGVCVALRDESWGDPSSWHPLRVAAEADLADRRFIELCTVYKNRQFALSEEVPGAEIKGGGFVMRPAAHQDDRGLMAVVAERVNSTLYWAERLDAVPVSNDELFNRVYGVKLRRVLEGRHFWDSRGLRSQMTHFNLSVLHWQLFAELIPREALLDRSVDDILTYKRESAALRDRYHTYVGMLETELTAEPWKESRAREVEQLVKRKVVPELEKLSEERRRLWEGLFGEIVRTTTQKRFLVPLVGATLIPGISYLDLLLFGMPIGAAAAVPKMTELVMQRARHRRNALFFLLNFR